MRKIKTIDDITKDGKVEFGEGYEFVGTAEEAVKAIQAATEATLIIDPDLKPMEGDLESLKV